MCFNMKNLALYVGFNCGSAGKESACNAGDLGYIPGLERYPGEGKGFTSIFECGQFHGQCTIYFYSFYYLT